MPIAPILKPIAQLGFLLQYYILLAAVIVVKLFYTIFRHQKSLEADFSYLPINDVHPHVFVHSRNYQL